MGVPETKKSRSPEELLSHPAREQFELVDGRINEKQKGFLASFVATRMQFVLSMHCQLDGTGYVLNSLCGYRCFRDQPDLIRKPDVSFIKADRLSINEFPTDFLRIPPDLVVEVVAPTDLADEIDRKVDEYLLAGVTLVWVIHPTNRTAIIYRKNGTIEGVRENGELRGENVLPEFTCQLRELFRLC